MAGMIRASRARRPARRPAVAGGRPRRVAAGFLLSGALHSRTLHPRPLLHRRERPRRPGLARARPVSLAERAQHRVTCPHCESRFELFSADWCGCSQDPGSSHDQGSKLCPSCGGCACTIPGYADPRLWAPAPLVFARHGFRRLFVAYV